MKQATAAGNRGRRWGILVASAGALILAFVYHAGSRDRSRPRPVPAAPAPQADAEGPRGPGVTVPTAEEAIRLARAKVGPRARVKAPASKPIVQGNDRLRKTYSEAGLTLTSPAGQLRVSLEDIRLGGHALPDGVLKRAGVAPKDGEKDEVVFARGGVTEKYVARGDAVEQIFVLDSSLEPFKTSGELTIRVSLETPLDAVRRSKEGVENREDPADFLEFKDDDGATVFTYGGAVAIDAAGRKRGLTYVLHGKSLEMTLDSGFLADARFPLTVDPLIGGILSLDASLDVEYIPDVAFSPVANSWLVVYENIFSAADGDIFCVAVSAAGAVSSPVTIDFTASDCRNPRVSRSNSNQFIVVFQGKPASRYEVHSQFVRVTGNVPSLEGGRFILEAAAGKDKLNPDVGYCPTVDRYVLAWEHVETAADHDILAKRVSTAVPPVVGPVVSIDTAGGSFEAFPSVSPMAGNPLVVGWVKRPLPGSAGDIYVSAFDAGLSTASTRVAVSTFSDDDDQPCVGGTSGTPAFVTWSRQPSGIGGNIHMRRVNPTLSPLGVSLGPVVDVENGPAHALRPACDLALNAGDQRLIVTWAQNPSYPPLLDSLDVHAKVYNWAFDPPTLVETLVVTNQTRDDDHPRVAINVPGMTALVVWDHFFTASDKDPYAQRVAMSPVAGFSVTPASLVTYEDGSTDSFTVVLTKAPTANVTVPINTSNPGEGTASPGSLLFTPSNWNIPQTVVVTGVDDDFIDGDRSYTIKLDPASSSDPAYSGLDGPDVSAINRDQDFADVIVTPLSLTTNESGTTATFTVRLNSAPFDTVTIPFFNGDASEGSVSPPSVSFDSTNWDLPQIVTVTGVNDTIVDGDQAYTVFLDPDTFTTDFDYNGFDPADVIVVNRDNDVAMISVNPVAGLQTTESGGQATFTIVLTSTPSANVTINLSSSDTTEGTVSPASVTFTPLNALTPQTVTVTGVNDAAADGNILYTIVTAPASSADGKYNTQNAADVSVTNTDDDTANIVVSPVGGLVTTESGGTANFSIVLATQPTANVTINLSSSNPGEGIISPVSVTFDAGNWNTPQSVTVTGQDELVDDGDKFYTIVTAPATSADPAYSGRDGADVSVMNTDNDTAGINVNPTSGLTTTEGGSGSSFTVVLTSQPTASVTINLSSSDTTEGTISPSSVTFTTANWSSSQPVNITGVNDFIGDGNIVYTILTAPATSSDTTYNGMDALNVTVTNLDDDTSGVIVSPTSGLTTTEAGGTATFTVRLATQPTANVTIALSSSNPAEGTPSPSPLTFTPANWNVNQTVTVTGADDAVDDGNVAYTILTQPASSTDPAYNGFNATDVSVTNTDNDTAGIAVSPVSGLTTTEAGGTATFTIVLTSQPTANVTIGVSSLDTSEGTASPASVTFTPGTWNTAQTVTVTGVDDFFVDGTVAYTIQTASATSTDPNYSGRGSSDVAVNNNDDDVAQVTVTPTSGLTTTEGGGTATFTVVLTSNPSNTVTIDLTSSDLTEGTVSPATLTFSNVNWSTPQTVTVTGANDPLVDGTVAYTILTAPAVSVNPDYNGLDPADVSVTNLDDDTPGITVSPTSGLTTTEAAGQATFTIRLDTQPTATVTIGLSSSNSGEGTVSPASVTFTNVNWNADQTVTVTGVNDDVDDGDKLYSIITAPATSVDGSYSGRNAADVSVTNTDNDTAGITAIPLTGLTTTESGGTATFTIVLNTQPTANVTIGLSSSDTTEGTVSPVSVTFTTGNWSAPQTVTVTGVDDPLVDGPVGYTIVTAAATSSDTTYSGMNAGDPAVTNTDNDSAGFVILPTAGLVTNEGAGTATFTVRLTSQPAGDVVLPLSSSDTTEGTVSPASLTFSAANWNVNQNVIVTGVNDAVADGAVAYSILTGSASSVDSAYSGSDPTDVSVTNNDDDGVGILVTPTSGLTTTEVGGTATFTIRLNSQPTADVTIGLSSSDTTEGNVSPASVTFTDLNWNVTQTVTVTGVDDFIVDGSVGYTITTGSAVSSDGGYSGLPVADVSVTNTDNDVAGFVVTPTSGLVTNEGGGMATFNVRLRSQPSAPVTIGIMSSNTAEGTVSTASLTFNAGNWSVDQPVTITGQNDSAVDGNVPYTVNTLPDTTTADTLYRDLNPADVSVTNNDDDVAGISVGSITGPTTEAAGQATFTVVLDTAPGANVSINLSSSDVGEGTVSPASLTFTPANWFTPQTVTVTGVDDPDIDGAQAYSIVTAAATSTDTNYSGFNAADVAVTNNDNDVAGIAVNPFVGLMTTEAGGTATFTVVLTSSPTANVTVNLTSTDLTEGTVFPPSMTFNAGNWNVQQTATVTGVDDQIVDGNIAYSITTAVATSDPNYSVIDPPDPAVTNANDDTAGFTVTPTGGLVTTESGGQATFTIRLDTFPSENVTIGISSSNTAEGTVSPLSITFTPTDALTPRTVTVTGANDAVSDGDQPYTIVFAADGGTTDTNYNGQAPPAVTATNQDNDVAGIQVTPVVGLVTTEAGGSATFNIVLNTQPQPAGTTVRIDLTSLDLTEGTVSPAFVQFNDTNWNVAQTVTVTGVNDAVDDGDIAYTIRTEPAVSVDAAYSGRNAADVSVTNTDNDTRGFVVTPTSGLTTTELGGTATFTVRLTSQPTASVTMNLTSSNANEGTRSPATLTFTPSGNPSYNAGTGVGDWNVDHVVTITGVDDLVADGNIVYTIVTEPVAGGDYGVAGLNAADVSVTNNDNDGAGFFVSSISGTTSEAGGTATFTIRLTSQPTANVIVNLSSSNSAEGTVLPASVTFTPSGNPSYNGGTGVGDWNVDHVVTVTGAEDAVDDGNVVYSIITAPATSGDPGYNGVNPANVSVTNVDDDSVGFTLTAISGNTTEAGGSATFTIVLTSQPTANVTIGLSSLDTSEGTVSPSSVVFTSANWNVAQTVTVTGVDDFIVDPAVVYTIQTAPATSADAGYNNQNPNDVSVTNDDNDVVNFVVTPTSGLTTTEGGGTATFTIRLTSQPSADVTIGLSVGGLDPDEGAVSPASVTFTSANWNADQTVTVTGQDDFSVDGNRAYTIVTAAASSADGGYNNQNAPDVSVTNNDNDAANFVVTPTSGLTTTEAGGTATFTVRLTSLPSAPVVIGVSSLTLSEGTVSPSSLTFNAGNWSANQTVTVTGVNDFVVDGAVLYTIQTAPDTTTADTNYVNLNPLDVTVTNTDDDTAIISVAPTSGLTTTEAAGGTATFSVVLTSQPAANVTIGISSSNTAEGTVSPATLTFTPSGNPSYNAGTGVGDWNVPHVVTVTGQNDFVVDGSIAYAIVTAAASSTDANYNGQNAPDVSVTNTDNDNAGINAFPVAGLSTTEAGGTGTFTIVLNSQPASDVTVNLSSTNTAEGTVSPATVTFTTSNWNLAQTVTVTGVDDFTADGNVGYTIVTAAAVSTDGNYNGFNASDVSVVNTDNDTAGFTILPASGLVTTEGGGTATFTVVLRSQPTGNVTLGLSSSSIAEGTVSPLSLTFTGANWNVPQTVTVTGADDSVVDGNVAYSIVTGSATSVDGTYNGINPLDVGVTNNDNDAADFVVTPTSGLATTEGGGTATFTVRLTSQPSANVVVGLSSSSTAEGTVSPASLTFTPANWNSNQTVTVTGVDDFVVDGSVPYTILTAPATSTDANYNNRNASDVSASNGDNDTAQIIVTPTTGLTTTESGGTATFTVRLNSQPTADVTVPLSSSLPAEGTVSPAALTFTAATWSTNQTVTVTGVNDFAVDGAVAYTIQTAGASSSDGSYNGMNAPDVGVTNNDDDTAGISPSPLTGLVTTEAAGSATFTVVLTSQPAANVTVGLSSSNTSEGTVSPATLTFTAANWNAPQTVTVTGVNDFRADGNVAYTIFTAPASSTDGNYNGLNASDVAVINNDDDSVGIPVSPVSGLVTTEAGGTGTFTVVLNSQPTSDVTVGLSSSNTSEGTVSPSTVTFTSANWNVPQTVTVTGADDVADDGDVVYTVVTAAATSTDGNYNGLNPSDVTVTNTDNDNAGFTVTPTSGLVTTEAGGTATFTVVLTSQPTANVTVGLSSSNASEGNVLPTSLTFTASNWNVPQTVTVTGVDDFVIDGTVAYSIVTAAASSTDTLYNGVNASDVAVTNQDNDVVGFTVTPVSGLVTTEAGGTATFTVRLNTIPSANVSIALSSSNAGEGTVSPPSLTFTPANALTPQTVTVTGVNDTVDDNDAAFTVITAPAVSPDSQYNGQNPQDVSVTNQDNDAAGVTVAPLAGLVTTEAGGTATFTVALTSSPTSNVTINLSSSNPAEGTVSPAALVFTPANALTPQTVTVTGVNDTIADGNAAYSIVTAASSSTDPAYNGVNPGDVSVTNQDNDVVGIAVTPTTGLTTTEAGGTATFSVVLTSTPSADVTIALSSSIGAEGSVSPALLTFTAANALTPQTVTVTGVDDTVADGNVPFSVITGAAVSGSGQYNGLDPADVSVTNQDDDVIGITVTPTTGLFTNEYGGTATFTVRLNTTPTSDVTVDVTSSNTAEGTVSTPTLTFTPANALTPQTVTVTGVDDAAADGNVAFSIVTAAALSADGNYSGVDAADVPVINLDNENFEITVTPTSGLTTTETGGTSTFTVVLNRVPAANVTMNLSSSNPAEGTPSPVTLTFTAADALTPQTVTVTGADDAVTDGDVPYTIVVGAASSSDSSYNGLNPPDVSVTNQDDEPIVPPRIALSAVNLTFTGTEGGANPADQSMSVTNVGGGSLNWSVTDDAPWLGLSPASGSLNAGAQSFMTVSVDITGLTAGTYSATITVTDPGASNSPQTVAATLTVLPPPPTLTITTPATDPTTTGSAPIALGGTASPGTTVVTWSNSATGETGTASGTTAWAASVPLLGGANFITVYAWNAGGAGSTAITINFTTDTVAPNVSVTFPTSSPTFTASSNPVTVAGSAFDNGAVTGITWNNLTTGTTGTATGTSSWITAIPLTNGSNVVEIVVRDSAGNTTVQVITINYSSPPDAGLPAIQILVPTTQATFGATTTPLTLAGTAADSVGITKVTWVNATTGGRGVANGTTNWSTSVPLAAGGNFISVTAYDPSGNTASAQLLVSFLPPTGDTVSPFLVITSPTLQPSVSTGTAAVMVGGFAADDVQLNTVVWENPAIGQTGTAKGLSSWTVDMILAPGNNLVTMTAYDTAGNKTVKQLAINFIPPVFEEPPVYVAAGHQECGSTGVDLLIPVALLWILRRAYRRTRKGTAR